MKEIFLKYKNKEITLIETIKLLDLANKTNDKKNEGVIYTPQYISDYIVEQLNYDPSKTILEPSVGHGVFVFSLINYIEKNFKLNGEQLKNWFEEKVFCFDINKKNIEDLKELLSIYFQKKGINNLSFKNIFIDDTLFFDFDKKFDFSFGNPPYVRTKNLNEKYLKEIRNKYKSCKTGNIDIYYAFMELMNNISTTSCFIVPNSYIYNTSAKSLRENILPNIDSIIDFKDKLIFENAKTYTSIYKTIKNKKEKTISYSEDINRPFIKFSKDNLNNKQWFFSELNDRDQNKKSIVELYDCYGSIATLKDKAYIIENPNIIESGNELYFIKNYNGVEYKIEANICIDFYKITKMNNKYKIIYPYQFGAIMNENYLKDNFPHAYIYLNAIRGDLDKRDKGKVDKYENWFAYGRKQGLKEKKHAYYLFLPLMASKEYKCIKIKHTNNFMITSGFVLGFDSENELDIVQKELESGRFFDYIKIKGKTWAGKEPYYSFTKTHLKDFYI